MRIFMLNMSKSIFIFCYLIVNLKQYKLQDTSECGVRRGCFLDPPNCQGSNCKFIYKYSADSNGVTFDIAVYTGFLTNPWIAIGFSDDMWMGNDGVVLCTSSGLIQQRYNKGKSQPALLDNSNPSIGVSNLRVSSSNGWTRCSFSRTKLLRNVNNYFDLNNNYYILGSYGQFVVADGSLRKHEAKTYTHSKVNFATSSIVCGGDKLEKIKAHGCLMVFAWMLIASTGMLLARYYKSILPNVKLLNMDFWFLLHRPMMILVGLMSLTAFLVILAELNWKWVSSRSKVSFAHSIFGIVAILLSFIQPIIAFFRCSQDHEFRILFNYFHRTLGLFTFIIALVALFLGTLQDDIYLGNNGWGILLGWSVWLIILIVVIEIIQFSSKNSERDTYKFDSVNSNENANKPKTTIRKSKTDRIKEFLLIVHIIVTLAFCIALTVIIGTSSAKVIKTK